MSFRRALVILLLFPVLFSFLIKDDPTIQLASVHSITIEDFNIDSEYTPIFKRFHPDYTGIERTVYDLLRAENLDKSKIKYYLRNVLELRDDGDAREYVYAICDLLDAKDFSSSAQSKFKSNAKKIVFNDDLDNERLTFFTDNILKEGSTYYQYLSLCDLIKDADVKAVKYKQQLEGSYHALESDEIIAESNFSKWQKYKENKEIEIANIDHTLLKEEAIVVHEAQVDENESNIIGRLFEQVQVDGGFKLLPIIQKVWELM